MEVQEMNSGQSLPENVHSMNAYLGYAYIKCVFLHILFGITLRGFPIAEALSLGADVVVTGRCVDSALTLGPLIHQVSQGFYTQLTPHC